MKIDRRTLVGIFGIIFFVAVMAYVFSGASAPPFKKEINFYADREGRYLITPTDFEDHKESLITATQNIPVSVEKVSKAKLRAITAVILDEQGFCKIRIDEDAKIIFTVIHYVGAEDIITSRTIYWWSP